jgi:DNA polymerase III subunit beta
VKITVRINEFKRVLEEARTVAPKKPLAGGAVLSYVRIDLNDAGQATMTASDFGITIIQSFEVVDGDASSFLLHAEKAHSLLKGLPGGTATMEVAPTSVVITAGGFVACVPSIRVSEFPDIVNPMPEAAHTISLKFLRRLLSLVEAAAPSKSVKVAIPAVQVEGTADRLRAVATDGYRIAVADQKISGGTEFTLLIPKYSVPLIKRRAGATVRFAESETHLFFQTDGLLLQFRKSAGRFPAYQQAITREAKTTLDVNSAELKSVVQRLNVIADPKNPSTYLNFENGVLSASASSVANGHAEVRIQAAATGIDNKVKLNPEFVLEFLAGAGDRTTISLVSERHLATFASGEFRHYVMPMVDEKPIVETDAGLAQRTS